MAMQHTPLLMSNILDRGATVAPNEEIVTLTETGVRRQSYRETRDRAHQLAHALAGIGIKVGRIGTFMWNGSRHLEAYHAVAGMGAVLHTLNPSVAEGSQYIINHAEDQIIIVDADVLPLLEVLNGKMPTVRKIIVATEDGFEVGLLPDPVDYEAFINSQPTIVAADY